MCLEAHQPRTKSMSKPEIKEKIVQFLQKSYPKDFNLIEISENVKIHRNTARTYVKVLVAEGKIKISRTMGSIILYSSSKEKNK